ncbi:hypothetical protein [Dietzia papillomatosis]|uniref:hypothetical protein n=1 Tax=Dietzia papillomatosis TaxID=282305 RepID=UPI000AF7B46E|nr:hypothetical protein [Dietzia papillomatosis]
MEPNSAPSGAHLNGQKGSDQQGREAVTTLEKRREDQIRPEKRETTRPPGGSPSATETEEKTRGEGQEPKGSPILSDPRFDPATLAPRLSALNKGSAKVDVAAKVPTPETNGTPSEPLGRPRTVHEQLAHIQAKRGKQAQPEGSGIVLTDDPAHSGKSLERMSPEELLDYIETFQREINGIEVSPGGPQGVATMRRFQADYGPQRAAAIIRELFEKNQGRCKVAKEVENITHRHFSINLRWFTDKIDVNLQAKSKAEVDVERDYIFASEL